jgi:hypothetical protein
MAGYHGKTHRNGEHLGDAKDPQRALRLDQQIWIQYLKHGAREKGV